MHVIVFLIAAWFAFYAIIVGRLDSALYLSGLAIATFVLAGFKKG